MKKVKMPKLKVGWSFRRYQTSIAVGVLSAVILVAAVLFVLNRSDININAPAGSNDDGDSYYYYNDDDGTGPTAPPNYRQPSSLTVSVSPNPLIMGGWIHGTVTSNGYNWPVTVYAKLLGNMQAQSFDAFLGSDGKYTQDQQLNTPGYWEFWAKTSEGVMSNVVSLGCEGILIVPSSSSYSRTFAHPITFQIYSNFKGTATLTATSPTGTPYTLGMVSVSSTGYGEGTFSMPTTTLGNYHVDCTLASHTASAYGGDVYISVGR